MVSKQVGDTHINSDFINTISSFHNRKRHLKSVQAIFLHYFAKKPYLSAYQIQSLHKSEHKSMIYKNVNKRVRRLYDLNLIAKVETESKHGAIYYKITTGGIYNLIHNDIRFFMTLLNHVLQHHGDNLIFTTLLYQSFERNTLLQITDTILISRICTYLYDCCEEIEAALDSINKNTGGSVTEQVFNWKDIPGIGNTKLMNFLKRKFNLSWLDSAEVIKFESDDIIKISNRANSLLIKLDKEKNKAILTMNRKKVYEFVIRRWGKNWISIEAPYESIEEYATKFFSNMAKSFMENLILYLVLGIVPDSIEVKVLSHDTKFMRLLKESEKKFKDHYQALLGIDKRS